MQDDVTRLRHVIERATPRLEALSASQATRRAAPGKWSPAELIGHLIDSASNNHGRFVRAQFHDDLVFAGYDQDGWIAAQDYHASDWSELVTLWRVFNRHIAHVMAATPEAIRLRPRPRHNLDQIAWRTVPADQPTTLDYFMNDYVGHLEHHLVQLLGAGALAD